MTSKNLLSSAQGILAAGFLAASILVAGAFAQSSQPVAESNPPVSANAPTADPSAGSASTGSNRRYQPNRFPKRASIYFDGVWGVDSLSV